MAQAAFAAAQLSKLSTAMDPTTLVTFIFRAGPEVRTVELLGSWDNFNQPYQMHHDRRRGQGFWSGCFKFDNIVFDGDGVQWSKPRKGGLKQGGTYWYYYRVNYDFDVFDDRQPNTTKCPLLPGQAVNIIDVPHELIAPPERAQSAYGDIIGTLAHPPTKVQTMEPEDKFAMLEPPPISKLHSRCLSDAALDGRLEGQQWPLKEVEDTVSPLSTPLETHLPRDCVDSKLDDYAVKDDISRGSSMYSQHSPRSISTDRKKVAENVEPEDLAALPTFPYPSCLGPAPLGSLEALGAALFASTSFLSITSSRSSRQVMQDHHALRKQSEASIGPKSVQNVQFYGSRPGTNLTQDPEQYRPRMYSLPNVEIRDRHDDDLPSMPGTSHSLQSPRLSDEFDESRTPDNDMGSPADAFAPVSGSDVISPLAPLPGVAVEDQDIALVGPIEPSSSNGSQIETRSQQAPAHDTRHPRPTPRPYVNYSLPTLASESTHSLAKTASTTTSRHPGPIGEVPSSFLAVLADGQGRSMAEDIFSELGF